MAAVDIVFSNGFEFVETAALTVNRSGNGSGTVTSDPAGISCGEVCSKDFAIGAMVTLTAVAAAAPAASLSNFIGWSGGGCSGNGTCVVTMTNATNVTATFHLAPNLAFVTSTTHTGNLGGVAGADSICQAHAISAGLPGTYRAWLSTTTTHAIDRFAGASGWVRVDGKPFVNSLSDLANQRLFTPLRITQSNTDAGASVVHTATNPNGTLAVTGITCDNYTSGSAPGTLVGGRADGQGGLWTTNGSASCGTSARLYCLGIDRAATVVPVEPASGYRRAFTTSAAFIPGTGIASADQLCTLEASEADLPGSYLALLATTGASAASRFDSGPEALPWGRPDGVLSAPTAAEFFSLQFLDSAPNTTANLSEYLGNFRTWGGATSVNVPGDASLSCSNWTSTGAGGGAGRVGFTEQINRFAGDLPGCNSTTTRITCLQQ